jgi:hypothetical protein
VIGKLVVLDVRPCRSDDPAAIARTIRKNGLASVRGDVKHNFYGFLIQPYWKLKVVVGADVEAIERGRDKVFERPDSFAEKCPAEKRL